jgi:hypothetical protein
MRRRCSTKAIIITSIRLGREKGKGKSYTSNHFLHRTLFTILHTTPGSYSLTLNALANILKLHFPTLTKQTPLFSPFLPFFTTKFTSSKPAGGRNMYNGMLGFMSKVSRSCQINQSRRCERGLGEFGIDDGKEVGVFGP